MFLFTRKRLDNLITEVYRRGYNTGVARGYEFGLFQGKVEEKAQTEEIPKAFLDAWTGEK